MALPGGEGSCNNTLSQQGDFNFNSFIALTAQDLNDSDSDGDTVNSDVEEAILAELYFRDVKSRSSGKRVSVARQLGSSQIRLDRSSDGTCTSISFNMDNQRKTRKHQRKQKSPVADHSASPNSSTSYKNACLNKIQEETTQASNIRSTSVKNKSRVLTSRGAERELVSRAAEKEGTDPGDRAGEVYEGVREMEDWEDSSCASSDASSRSSDMDISGDSTGSVGQLYLRVDEKDVWHIILKDVMGSEEYEKQYGGRTFGRKFTKCFNCKQKGQHQSNSCPHPIRHQACYICAGYDHISSRCSSEFCTYCFQKQHRGKPCSTVWGRQTVCQRCYSSGHSESMCHEQWRQYHNTTAGHSGGSGLFRIQPNQQRQSKRVFCFNCGKKGHFGHECPRKRPRGFSDPLTPHIVVYDAARDDRKRKLHSRHGSRRDHMSSGREPTREDMNDRVKRGCGLLETPPSLLDQCQDTSFNESWGKEGGHSRMPHNRHMNRFSNRSSEESSRYVEYNRYGSEGDSAGPSLLGTPHPSAVPSSCRSSFHTPPAGGRGFSDDDCQVIGFQPPPKRTQSEPQNRRFPPDHRFSHDTLHQRRSSLHEEQDFPRTPLPNRDQRQSGDFRDVLPPPAKSMRRQSEQFDHRFSPSHDRPNRQMMSTVDYRRRSSGYERGFRGSDRTVSLIHSHYEDNSYHRTRYGDR